MQTLEIVNRLEQVVKTKPSDYQTVSDLFEMIRLLENEGDKDVAHEKNFLVRRITSEQAMNKQNSLAAREKFYSLYKKALLFDAPVDFDAYMQYIEFDRDPEKRFYLPRRLLLQPLVKSLQDIEDDKLDLLSVSLPPGTGKSTCGIFFLSWQMGKYPNMPNLASAHSSKLTRSFFDGVDTIITDPEYLWHDVFPNVVYESRNAKEESINLDKPSRFKSLTCRSIDGSLTGATRCERILYADDLVSGIEEAMSIDRMDSLWMKYTNDLKSRKKQGCKEIHIATRWSVHDPIGRLERMYIDDKRARFLAIPALNENDESNFDYGYGVGFSTKYFLDMRDTLDEVSWKCLFQNQPIEREGLVFPVDSLRRYTQLPEGKPDYIIGACDTAEGGGDDTVLFVGYGYGDEWYIEDCVCSDALPEITDALCVRVLTLHKVQKCRFESNSAGGRTAEKVASRIKEWSGITQIEKRRNNSNKTTRIFVNSDFIKAKFWFKDKRLYEPQSQYGKMMSKLTSYSAKGKNKHDDVPDGLTQLAEFIQSLKGTEVKIFKRPF